MSNQEVIREVKAIQIDLAENKISYDEALQGLKSLESETGIAFSYLYNAFYSSKPEMYIN